MQIGTRTAGDILIVDIVGRLDTQTADDASHELLRIARSGSDKVLLNLDQLEYVSSAGLRVILQAAKILQASDGEIKICQANGLVKEVMEASGFNRLVKMYATEKDAYADF